MTQIYQYIGRKESVNYYFKKSTSIYKERQGTIQLKQVGGLEIALWKVK